MKEIQTMTENQTDIYVFGAHRRNRDNSKLLAPIMPTARNASEYNMKHKNRGQAHIFNHEKFDYPNLGRRTGTDMDCSSLNASFKKLNFDVTVHQDKTVREILQILEEVAQVDHTDSDCIVVAILSHGEMGYIYARDSLYKLDSVAQYFTADKCKTLAGKPKLFFLQTCQGGRIDLGIKLVKNEMDGECSTSYTIPVHADFLFAYSTIPGFLSVRDATKGSWFIQSLCTQLDENGQIYDILTLLTFVCQRVAIDFESEPYKKQIPCATTMLTRILRFPDTK